MDMSNLALMAAAMAATGIVGGILAGLLGVGGGIIIVPVLDAALGLMGVDPDVRMHVAVATSLATIIPTSISSSRAHRARGSVDEALVKRWAPAILLGAATGTVIAAHADGRVLASVFAGVAFLVAIKMALPAEKLRLADAPPTGLAAQGIPFSIGTVSTIMGIGGGTVSVPIMTALGETVHRAVGTAALFGLFIAIPGTLGYIISGWGNPLLPLGSLGYLNLIGLALIAPMTWIAAPWGAALAHRLSKRQLSFAFAGFLLIVAVRMALRALG